MGAMPHHSSAESRSLVSHLSYAKPLSMLTTPLVSTWLRNFKACKRTKHIDRRIHFLTDYQEAGAIQVLNISTAANTADGKIASTCPLNAGAAPKHVCIDVTILPGDRYRFHTSNGLL